MTSDIERPRQRTVAELLAEHGDTASSSRRRRRRSPDDEPAESVATVGAARPMVAQRTSPSPRNGQAYPAAPDAPGHTYFEPADNDRREAYRAAQVPAPPVPREYPTDVMPRVSGAPGHDPDAEVTGPIPVVAAGAAPAVPHRPADADGGPPTQYSPGVVEDEDDESWADDEWDDEGWDEESDDYAGDHDQDEARAGHGDHDDHSPRDEFVEDDYADEADEPEPEEDAQSSRRGRGGATSAPSWPAVIAQWIAGAIGGAALWVAFRFLWKGFPVVAVAAALAVTAGLVIIVRALLHNRDLRTTVFAVLVGLLLTASPAILVLIGR